MATIYSTPTTLPDPPDFPDFKDANGRLDFNAHQDAETAWIELVQAEACKANSGTLVGKIIRFPVADGYAQYVVWKQKPLQLIHLAIGDAWSIPAAHERGVNLADVRAMVGRDRAMAELFGRKSA